mgnify:CR=1 FL=1
MNERIRELRKALGLTLEKFGESLGVGKTAISKIENGDRNVTDQMQKSICREFNVSTDWLLYGTGEMFVTHTHDEEVAMYTQDILDSEDDEIAKIIQDFIVVYGKLDNDSKSVLRNVAKSMIDLHNKRETP